MKFLDQAKIYVKSGSGGPGSISFRREKFIEFGGYHPALVIAMAVLIQQQAAGFNELLWDIVDYGNGFELGKDGRAAVTFFGPAGIPVLFVAGQVYFGLPLFSLGLLQAQDIGAVCGHKLLEFAFSHYGTDAINVPRVNLHAVIVTENR